mmetsp:Transcript_23538/g.55026  ORF Transcript_23538/g.55026 Transcript_23538/m.55026 type:complete len:96 (+) Transcript_23538:409-696(+)
MLGHEERHGALALVEKARVQLVACKRGPQRDNGNRGAHALCMQSLWRTWKEGRLKNEQEHRRKEDDAPTPVALSWQLGSTLLERFSAGPCCSSVA